MGAMTIAWSLNASAAAPGVVTLLGVRPGVLVVVLALTVRPRALPEARHAPDRAIDDAVPAVPALDASAVFQLAVAAEVVAGVVVVARAGLTDYIQPVMALVVALHFPIFLVAQRFWLHLVAGVVGGVGTGLAVVLMATGSVGPKWGRAIAGLALAYGTAFVTALRQPSPAATSSDQRTAGRRVSA